jgi:hypothetical protein
MFPEVRVDVAGSAQRFARPPPAFTVALGDLEDGAELIDGAGREAARKASPS